MIAAVCLDENNGMCFNHRRLSRDAAQQADLLAWCADRPLWMSPDSARLFDSTANLRISDDFLNRAGPGEVCFVEDRSLTPVLEQLEALVVYRWNRVYPADRHLDVSLEEKFILHEQTDFPGKSHPRITRQIYRPRK